MRAAIASGARTIMIPDLVGPEPDVASGASHIFPPLSEALARHAEWFRRA